MINNIDVTPKIKFIQVKSPRTKCRGKSCENKRSKYLRVGQPAILISFWASKGPSAAIFCCDCVHDIFRQFEKAKKDYETFVFNLSQEMINQIPEKEKTKCKK